MKAFVDSREPEKIKNECGFGSRELPQGDFYLPEYDVVVERKEASDFASSTTDGRLSEQADRMVAEHEHVYVIVEGSPYELKYSNINANSVTGMQTSLAVKRGIKIIYTESVSDTCYAVHRIFERFADEEHEQAESGYVKTSDTGEVEDTQVAMLMQVDGISEEKARAILDRNMFSTLAAAPEDELREQLQRIDGIGLTLAQRVIDSFK